MAVYGYARVSHAAQAQSGLGLAAQQAAIRAACRARGWRLTAIYIDRAVSGTRPFGARPQGAALSAKLKPGDHVIVAKLDRAWRHVRDCAETMETWRARGIYAHLLDVGVDTSTPVGELVIGVMSAIAQWESRRIGERIREAKAAARARGRIASSNPAYGWRHVRGRRRVDRAMREAAARALARRRAGWLMREIAAALTRERVPRHPWNGPRARRRPWSVGAACRLIQAALRHGWRTEDATRGRPADRRGDYRHATGERKRAARLKVSPERRRAIALLGAAARAEQRAKLAR